MPPVWGVTAFGALSAYDFAVKTKTAHPCAIAYVELGWLKRLFYFMSFNSVFYFYNLPFRCSYSAFYITPEILENIPVHLCVFFFVERVATHLMNCA